jgi:hypothetical protein
MNWQKAGPDTIRSDAGYAIARGQPDTKNPTEYFLAFCKRPGTPLHELVLGRYDTADEARTACEAHFAKLEQL